MVTAALNGDGRRQLQGRCGRWQQTVTARAIMGSGRTTDNGGGWWLKDGVCVTGGGG